MSELPKIALKRLRAGASMAPAAGTGPGPFQGSEHPDSNLLSAFAEQSLTNAEREQVLEHLSHCAECREIAALLPPAEAEVAVIPHVAEERRWNFWPVLRWGSLIAALGVVTIVVGLHTTLWRGNRQTAVAPPPAPAAGQNAEQLQADAPAPAPVPGSQHNVAPEEIEKQKEAFQKRAEEMALKDQLVPPAKKDVSRMATSQAPAGLHIENAPGSGISRRESLGDRAISMGTVQPPAAAAAPSPPPSAQPASSASAAKTSADMGKTSPSIRAEAEGPVLQSENKQQVGLAGGAGATSASSSGVSKAAAQVGQQSNTTARGGMFGMMAARRSLKASAPAVVWNVSGGGKLQRSTDGAKSFATVEVIPGVKFAALAAMADEVWAGGENGALFHSLDGGASWAQVKVGSDSNPVRESISAIEFSARKLVLVTASGARWTSNDDGQNWNQLP